MIAETEAITDGVRRAKLAATRANRQTASDAFMAALAAYDAAEEAWVAGIEAGVTNAVCRERELALNRAHADLAAADEANCAAMAAFLEGERAETEAIAADVRLVLESLRPLAPADACATCGSATCCKVCGGTGWDPETNPGMSGEACWPCGGSGGR